MTIVQITRGRLVRAIMKEPLETLRPGAFIRPSGPDFGFCKARDKNCSVCGVGAVLRQVLASDQSASDLDIAGYSSTAGEYMSTSARSGYNTAEWCLKSGRYMSALSCLFEGLSREYAPGGNTDKITARTMRRVLVELVKFVEKEFPAKITIDINGAKPARDVRVVSS